MSSAIVNKILERIGNPDLVDLLTDKISGSELNTLLLEVFNRKVSKITPSQLLNLYQLNRFVKPGDLPVLALKRMECDLLEHFEKFSFEALELSPVAALGSCAVVAPADQKKILTALRGTEVLADATNAIALHVSDLKQRRKLISSHGQFRFSTIQRHVRTQTIRGNGFTPHFKIACLVTCGCDTGNYNFEKESLFEHITVMDSLYRDYFKVDDIRFRLIPRNGYEDPSRLVHQLKNFVTQQRPEISIDIVEKSDKENNYYKGIQYKIDIRVKGKHYEIGDGGFVDWTQQLLQNKKERMLSTGIGFEFMYRILDGRV
jgi:hypothetical protein